MIKMLQNLEQGSVTEQERKKIDKLVRDMKDEVGQVVKNLHQELKEAETELSGPSGIHQPVEERANGEEKKGEKGKKDSSDHAELTDTMELEVGQQDLVQKVPITTVDSSSDEESCTNLSSGAVSSDDDDTRRTNGPGTGSSQEMEGNSMDRVSLDRKERKQQAVKSIDMEYHHIVWYKNM